MRASLRRVWESWTTQKRAIVVALAVVTAAALYVWLVHSAERARTQLSATITTLRAQAARLDQAAAEYARLRAAPAITASPTDLRTLMLAQAGAAGLSQALVRIDAQDSNQVQVVFGTIAFTNWLAWVSNLQSQQVRLETCRIEALSTAGLVSITATFIRTKSQ